MSIFLLLDTILAPLDIERARRESRVAAAEKMRELRRSRSEARRLMAGVDHDLRRSSMKVTLNNLADSAAVVYRRAKREDDKKELQNF